MITNKNVENKKGRAKDIDPVFSLFHSLSIHFLNNFFLPYPASRINPEPRRSMAADLGIGAAAPFAFLRCLGRPPKRTAEMTRGRLLGIEA
jgi:hypothetical protein